MIITAGIATHCSLSFQRHRWELPTYPLCVARPLFKEGATAYSISMHTHKIASPICTYVGATNKFM